MRLLVGTLALTAAYVFATGTLAYLQAEARARDALSMLASLRREIEQCQMDAAGARGELRAFQWAMKCAKRGECDEIVSK